MIEIIDILLFSTSRVVMIALAIVLTVIIIFALLRFGVAVEYGEAGFIVTARAGPIRIDVFPREVKPGDQDKKAAREARKKLKAMQKEKKKKKEKTDKESVDKTEVKKTGSLEFLLSLLPPICNTLGRLRRRLLIKKLIIHFTAAGDDPSKTATTYGAANAAFGTLIPILEKGFRIRKRDLRAFTDFCSEKPSVYISAAISIAIWETFYIAFAMLPALFRILNRGKVSKDRKDEN